MVILHAESDKGYQNVGEMGKSCAYLITCTIDHVLTRSTISLVIRSSDLVHAIMSNQVQSSHKDAVQLHCI